MSEEVSAPVESAPISDSTEATETPVEASQEASESTESVIPSEGVEGTEGVEAPAEEASTQYDIVVDGETLSVSLDDLVKGFQLKSASNKRFQEAAHIKKQAEEEAKAAADFRSKLLQNPYDALLEEVNKDNIPFEAIRDHYEDVVYKLLQMDAMSDEEKAAHKQQAEFARMQKEYAKLQEELTATNKAKEDEKFQQQVAVEQEKIAVQLKDAISKKGLPATPEAIREVATRWHTAIESNSGLDLDDIIDVYKDDMNSSMRNMFTQLPEDTLLSLLGEEKMNAIRKKDLEKVTNPSLSSGRPSEPVKSNAEKIAASSFFDEIKKSTYRR